MLLPKRNGRKTLRDELLVALADVPHPTLANLVRVFERVSVMHQIENTQLSVVIVAWPVAKRLPPFVDVALALGFQETSDDWDEPPGNLMLCFKVRTGLLGYLASRYNGHFDPQTDECIAQAFTAFSHSNLFRWFGARNAYDVSAQLSTPDDFFSAMTKLLPALKEAGLICCSVNNDTRSCSIPDGG